MNWTRWTFNFGGGGGQQPHVGGLIRCRISKFISIEIHLAAVAAMYYSVELPSGNNSLWNYVPTRPRWTLVNKPCTCARLVYISACKKREKVKKKRNIILVCYYIVLQKSRLLGESYDASSRTFSLRGLWICLSCASLLKYSSRSTSSSQAMYIYMYWQW